ncbi:MAG: hypothetical protein KC421_12395 [Anaerolineales bacterium]|nr:hypothetical protein [Anaerolineales bacterium]
MKWPTLDLWQIELTDLYAEAKAAVKDGRFHDALLHLKHLVQTNPEHENGWLALSRLSKNPELQIIALEKAVALNPNNKKGKTRLKALRKDHQHPFKLGRAFESVGEPQKALDAYRQAAWQAKSKEGRKAARDRQDAIKQQLRQKNMRITTPSLTLMRLGAGPTTLYLLLLLIQAGLNPLRVPILLLVGTLFVLAGSLLLTAIHLTPNHRLWQQLLQTPTLNLAQQAKTAVFSFIGFVCVALPFVLLFLHSVNRLEVYKATVF